MQATPKREDLRTLIVDAATRFLDDLCTCQPLAALKAATRSAWLSSWSRFWADETRTETATFWERTAGAAETAPRH